MIQASRCPVCRRHATPPEPRCLGCGAETAAELVDPEGRVLACTSVASGWVALLELEGGARLLARLDERPRIGAGVTVPERQA